MAEPPQLVRIADVASELGLSQSRIRQLADSGAIPSTRSPGGHRLFDLGAVRAAVARRTLPDDPLTVAQAAEPSWTRELTLLGLSEDSVWRRVSGDLGWTRRARQAALRAMPLLRCSTMLLTTPAVTWRRSHGG